MMTSSELNLVMVQAEMIELLLEELRDHLNTHDAGWRFSDVAAKGMTELKSAVDDVNQERARAL